MCKTGPEVHEHIDQRLFGRLTFPQWLVTPTVEEYVQADIRLADNHALHNQLQRELSGIDAVQTIFQRRPKIMGRTVDTSAAV